MSEKSNMQDDVVLHHLARILEAQRVKDAAAKEYAASRKLAKGDGVDLKTLDAVVRLMALDSFELTEGYNDLVRYARLFNVPVYGQLDLFAVPEDTDEEIFGRAYASGLQGGKTGKDQSVCPHGFETPAGQKWLEGWHDGQAVLMSAIKAFSAPAKLEKSDKYAEDDLEESGADDMMGAE